MSTQKGYLAIVDKVVSGGRHGPYAVAVSEEIGPVTFSLNPNVWTESDWPEEGVYVVLSLLRKKRAGWRAQSGRFLNPSDEQRGNREEGAGRQ